MACKTPRPPTKIKRPLPIDETVIFNASQSETGIPSSKKKRAQVLDPSLFEPPKTARLPQTKGKNGPGEIAATTRAPTAVELYKKMPQSLETTYKAVATFFTALFLVVRHGWVRREIYPDQCKCIAGMHPDCEAILDKVPRLLRVDFSDLYLPWLGYADLTAICRKRVELMDAMAVHYDGNFGLVMRALGGEYTGEWRDVDAVLAAIEPHCTPEDSQHIARILRRGCPHDFNWEEDAKNKETFIRQGNAPSVNLDCPHVNKALVKDWKNSNVMCFSRFWTRASPYARVTPQTMRKGDESKGKKWRLIWDGTTKLHWWEQTMNEQTPTENKAIITFGQVFMLFIIWL